MRLLLMAAAALDPAHVNFHVKATSMELYGTVCVSLSCLSLNTQGCRPRASRSGFVASCREPYPQGFPECLMSNMPDLHGPHVRQRVRADALVLVQYCYCYRRDQSRLRQRLDLDCCRFSIQT